MEEAQFGMIGLGTMGRNFLLNVAEKGFSCAGYDLDSNKALALNEEGAGMPVRGFSSLPDFLDSLAGPKNIMLLVPAGKIVDSVIGELVPHLSEGDLIIDGGNSHYPDTERREAALREKGLNFLGVGVSGGSEGARHGPSIMIGGDPEVYERVRPLLEAVSAKVDGDPCAAHVGNGSAGHFVKMVHNGIEYGLMQLICESYDILSRLLWRQPEQMSRIFEEWNEGELNSFLIEITSDILRKKDDETGEFLVDLILDTAGQKGTGRWTSEAALAMGIPIPTIDTAVTLRQISAMKETRLALQSGSGERTRAAESDLETDTVRRGLLTAFIVTYAQGLSLLAEASKEKEYELDLAEITKIWRGGCIIRARLLETFREIYSAKADLSTLLLDGRIAEILKENEGALRSVTIEAIKAGVPANCFAASLGFLDAMRTGRLPANLLQAQRDYFGAHTYKRTDREGTFTTVWSER